MILLGFIPYAVVWNADKSKQLSADINVIVTVFYGIATCSSPLIHGAMSTEIRTVCMSCISQCVYILKCAPCVRLRRSDRMLSLSQMSDVDVSPASDSRNVQVKDATTQTENETVNTKANNSAQKCKANGCDIKYQQEIEPLYNKTRCCSIEEEEDQDKDPDTMSLPSLNDYCNEAQSTQGEEDLPDTKTVVIPMSHINKNNNTNMDNMQKSNLSHMARTGIAKETEPDTEGTDEPKEYIINGLDVIYETENEYCCPIS